MSWFPHLLLAQKPPTSVMDALPHLTGMLVVFVTLAVLWGVCAATARLVSLLTPAPAPVMMMTGSAPPAPQPVDDATIAPEIVAVIAAAVATVTGPAHRIVSIRRQSTSWEKAGRQSVLTSHRIR